MQSIITGNVKEKETTFYDYHKLMGDLARVNKLLLSMEPTDKNVEGCDIDEYRKKRTHNTEQIALFLNGIQVTSADADACIKSIYELKQEYLLRNNQIKSAPITSGRFAIFSAHEHNSADAGAGAGAGAGASHKETRAGRFLISDG